jgi:hypothetical protein
MSSSPQGLQSTSCLLTCDVWPQNLCSELIRVCLQDLLDRLDDEFELASAEERHGADIEQQLTALQQVSRDGCACWFGVGVESKEIGRGMR